MWKHPKGSIETIRERERERDLLFHHHVNCETPILLWGLEINAFYLFPQSNSMKRLLLFRP